MKSDYVKLHRKIIDSSFYKNSTLVHLAIHCMISASDKKKKVLISGREIELIPGQFITGQCALSCETGISRQSIRTALKILAKIKFINIKSDNQYSLITVINYFGYQND
jgi:hypothetical protein